MEIEGFTSEELQQIIEPYDVEAKTDKEILELLLKEDTDIIAVFKELRISELRELCRGHPIYHQNVKLRKYLIDALIEKLHKPIVTSIPTPYQIMDDIPLQEQQNTETFTTPKKNNITSTFASPSKIKSPFPTKANSPFETSTKTPTKVEFLIAGNDENTSESRRISKETKEKKNNIEEQLVDESMVDTSSSLDENYEYFGYGDEHKSGLNKHLVLSIVDIQESLISYIKREQNITELIKLVIVAGPMKTFGDGVKYIKMLNTMKSKKYW